MKGKIFGAFLLLLIISIAITVFAIQNDDKTPEAQPEAPLTAETKPEIQDQTLSSPAFDKLVSVTFDNAPLADVMRWLTQQGVQLAAETTQRDNRKLTLNAQNQPLRDVLLAIAGAFDAKWERQGEILTLKRNPVIVGEWDDSMFKNLRDFPMPRLDSEKLRQFFQEHRFSIPPDMDFEKFEFDIEKFFDEENLKLDMKKLFEGRGNLFERLRSFPSSTFSIQNIEKVYESLTPEQVQKHEAQGYLLFDDLTAEQKKMLGMVSNGTHWVISIARDGKQFTLRSHPK